jgi:hypothetical protein
MLVCVSAVTAGHALALLKHAEHTPKMIVAHQLQLGLDCERSTTFEVSSAFKSKYSVVL